MKLKLIKLINQIISKKQCKDLIYEIKIDMINIINPIISKK